MKYKVKRYPDGRVLLIEDYPGVDVNVGKQEPVDEQKVDLSKEDFREIKKEKSKDKMLKKLKEKLK